MTKIIFVQAEYKREIILSDKLINYLKKNKIKSLVLFASAQFLHLEKIINQLNELGIEAVVTKAKRSEKIGQILGCNIYEDNFENDIFNQSDAVVYIGDGAFHPSALLLAGAKTVLIYNPISKSYKVIAKKDIEKQISKIKTNLRKFINSRTIGILVSLKSGQEHLVLAEKLKIVLKKQDKKAFIFVDDNINLSNMENFNFIEAWVNSTCPRIGSDDTMNISKPIVNIKDAFEPIKVLERLG